MCFCQSKEQAVAALFNIDQLLTGIVKFGHDELIYKCSTCFKLVIVQRDPRGKVLVGTAQMAEAV